MEEKNISIGEASKLLNVSIDTLRRWDASGKLKAIRESVGKRTHRYYSKKDIDAFKNDLLKLAKDWVIENSKISDDYYCSNSAVFQARLIKLQSNLENIKDDNFKKILSLVVAVAGEIGNNSFDHNLGNWPDVPGIFFGYDVNKRMVVLADRGQGILKTLSRVRPELKNDSQALEVAFTEVVSGRAPEERGNGLKFVKSVVEKTPMYISFQTGDAGLELKEGEHKLVINKMTPSFRGCLVLITF